MGPADTNESSLSENVFDSLPVFCKVLYGVLDELTCYMYFGPNKVKNKDLLKWWHEHQHIYPHLTQMALNYHTVPCKLCLLLFSGF
jgi:hAT family protein